MPGFNLYPSEARAQREEERARRERVQRELQDLKSRLEKVIPTIGSTPDSTIDGILRDSKSFKNLASVSGWREEDYEPLSTLVTRLALERRTELREAERDRQRAIVDFLNAIEAYGNALATMRAVDKVADAFQPPQPATPPSPDALGSVDLDHSHALNMANVDLQAYRRSESRYLHLLDLVRDGLDEDDRAAVVDVLESALAQARTGIADAEATIAAHESGREPGRKVQRTRAV